MCFAMSFLDGPGTGKEPERGMGVNSGECQRFQIDLEISLTPKAVLFRAKTWKLWKLVATHPGLGAGHRTVPGDLAGCCSGPGKHTLKEQGVLRLQVAHVAVVALCLGPPLSPAVVFSLAWDTLLGHISLWEQ